jgi:hypothetical protein
MTTTMARPVDGAPVPSPFETTITLPVVCSWCKKQIGTKDGFAPSLAGTVTHGICPECLPTLRASYGLK